MVTFDFESLMSTVLIMDYERIKVVAGIVSNNARIDILNDLEE